MRAYKLFAAAAGLALVAGCAEDGKDGADGAKGDKGDKGDPGEPGQDGNDGVDGVDGTDGVNGTDGEDAACAAFEQLVISDVIGLDDAVFPGQDVPFEFEFAGGSGDVNVQFIGTMRNLDGTATIPGLPTSGTVAGSYSLNSAAEGDISYVVVATDGCTVATTTIAVKVRSALISIVHLNPNYGPVGFKVRGTTTPLIGIGLVDTIFGPMPAEVATIAPGSAFLNYFRVAQADIDFDMHPDLDGNGLPDLDSTPVTLPKITLVPDGRVIVVAYAGGAKDEFAILRPDHSLVTQIGAARFQFAHLAGGVGPVDISTAPEMTPQLIQDAAIGSLSGSLTLPPLDYTVFVDATADGAYDFEVYLPFERAQVLPGDYTTIMAWLDGDGMLQIFNHTTGGNGTEYEGQMYTYPGTVFVNLGTPDTDFTMGEPLEVGDYGTASVDFAIEAEADCRVDALEVTYQLNAVDPNWLSDVVMSITTPSGKTVVLGTGRTGGPGVENGRFQVMGALDFELAAGDWSVTVDDGYDDGSASAVTLNELSVSVFCMPPVDSSTVTVDEDPDLAIADDPTTPSTSTAVITDACTVIAVLVDYAVTHTFASDLGFALKSPTGADFVDLGNAAGAMGGFGPVTAFEGVNGQGTWTLQVTDEYAGDEGTLDEWTLTVFCE